VSWLMGTLGLWILPVLSSTAAFVITQTTRAVETCEVG